MPRCGRPARRAVSRPVCADEKNPALSVDRKLFGTSTIGSHPARSAPAVAPHDSPRSADACRSAIGRPILILQSLRTRALRNRRPRAAITGSDCIPELGVGGRNRQETRPTRPPSGLIRWFPKPYERCFWEVPVAGSASCFGLSGGGPPPPCRYRFEDF